MKQLLLYIFFFGTLYQLTAQVGINNTDPKAALDISASASPSATDGILIPRVDEYPTGVDGDQNGMLVFLTGDGTPPKGFYYWDQTATSWLSIQGTKNTLDEAYDEGGAGAGRTITADAGAFNVDGEDGFQVTGTFGVGDDASIGAGTALIFNPKKASFRAGFADGTQWNAPNVGDYSIAMGNNVIASALYSTAIGFNINVSGTANVGLGTGHVVDGFVATAFGGGNTSSGSWSTAMGIQTFALGDKSLSTGEATSANGEWSSAFGQNTIAGATHSFSIGRFNIGSGNTSSWVATDAIFEIGNGTTNANRSNAFSVLKNGTVTINEAYSLPIADGTAGYVIATDGSGTTTWTDPNTLVTGVEKIDDLIDGKSDSDGSEDGSSVFLGVSAGASDDSTNNRNVGVGYQVLEDNTEGDQNTALGYHSLWNNIDGSSNTAVGSASLAANTIGIWNTAVGQSALDSNVDGFYNTALGRGALAGNTDGNSNVALGVNAIASQTSGNFNTAIGTDVAVGLTSGNSNTMIGRRAMNSFTSGGDNVAIGASAGYYGSGSQNTYVGTTAGFSPAGPARSGSVFLGYAAGSTEATSNKLYIENSTADADNALVYGEFDTNILRVNGTLQVSNPTGTGYALPAADGTIGQVLTTDGAGAASWSTAAASITSADNGLTVTAGNVRLGGALVEATTITHGANNYIHNLNSGGEFIVLDGGLASFIVNNNGFTGIGENASSPAYQLNVEDTRSNSYVANFENNASNLDADGISIRCGVGSSNNHLIDFYRTNGQNVGSVRGAGSGVSYATTSDRRLKMNIKDIDQALQLIKSMQPRWYRYKEIPTQEEYGFIAQELQAVYPQAVSGSPDSDVTKDPMMVDYGRLTPILTAGIKELLAKVEVLEAENMELKQQLQKFENLEARIMVLEGEKR